jgi:hypothetical protein
MDRWRGLVGWLVAWGGFLLIWWRQWRIHPSWRQRIHISWRRVSWVVSIRWWWLLFVRRWSYHYRRFANWWLLKWRRLVNRSRWLRLIFGRRLVVISKSWSGKSHQAKEQVEWQVYCRRHFLMAQLKITSMDTFLYWFDVIIGSTILCSLEKYKDWSINEWFKRFTLHVSSWCDSLMWYVLFGSIES